MTVPTAPRPAHQRWQTPVAIAAFLFGALTVFSGATVLFGPQAGRDLAGDYIAWIVWFNLLAGVFYIIAAAGLLRGAGWTGPLAGLIAAATALAALGFIAQIATGAAYEMRTAGALAFRFGFWGAVALALIRSGRK